MMNLLYVPVSVVKSTWNLVPNSLKNILMDTPAKVSSVASWSLEEWKELALDARDPSRPVRANLGLNSGTAIKAAKVTANTALTGGTGYLLFQSLSKLGGVVQTVASMTPASVLNTVTSMSLRGALATTIGGVKLGSSFAWGLGSRTLGVVAGLNNTTKACLAGGLLLNYYALPKIRKLYTSAPLPYWVWGSDARRVTPWSRWVEGVTQSLWKSNEPEPVLNADVRDRLETIITANKNILTKGGCFKNILLLGEPGIGKTMLVEKIARDSGFNYIKISGGDFSWRIKAGSAVRDLMELIKFSRESTYPTVLVIDEIDAICPNPEASKDGRPTDEERNFRNTLLAATGGRSNKLLIVGTTNHERDIDPALLSRLNNRIQMNLPDYESRVKILTQNIDKYLGQKIPERSSCLSEEKIGKLAERTEGMSGRSLFQFVDGLAMQKNASSDQLLTEEVIEEELTSRIDDLKRDRAAKEERALRREQEWAAQWGGTVRRTPVQTVETIAPIQESVPTVASSVLENSSNSEKKSETVKSSIEVKESSKMGWFWSCASWISSCFGSFKNWFVSLFSTSNAI